MAFYTASAAIDLAALCSNYALLAQKSAPGQTAAVVKANAYGLGAKVISQTLAERAGCRHFFVATIDEALEIRPVLPDSFIGIFYGVNNAEEAKAVHAGNFIPVLNSTEQIRIWQEYCHPERSEGSRSVTRDSSPSAQNDSHTLPAVIHVDTGMTRTGISMQEAENLSWEGMNISCIMSHLACADMPQHPLNAKQMANFAKLRSRFPGAKFSLANSSGLFLGADFGSDLARPGMALYGLNPTPYRPNPMQNVVTLEAPILQIRTLTESEYVGYGATFRALKGTRLAVAAIGYADGLIRSLSNKGSAFIHGYKVPIAGIVSMDLTVLDVSAVPEDLMKPGDKAEFFGKNLAADEVAAQAGTIGYELFTGLTPRVKRLYIE
jgi:alanine racemase